MLSDLVLRNIVSGKWLLSYFSYFVFVKKVCPDILLTFILCTLYKPKPQKYYILKLLTFIPSKLLWTQTERVYVWKMVTLVFCSHLNMRKRYVLKSLAFILCLLSELKVREAMPKKSYFYTLLTFRIWEGVCLNTGYFHTLLTFKPEEQRRHVLKSLTFILCLLLELKLREAMS